jgi:hypothetical protein
LLNNSFHFSTLATGKKRLEVLNNSPHFSTRVAPAGVPPSGGACQERQAHSVYRELLRAESTLCAL